MTKNILYVNVSRILKKKGMQRKDLAKKMGCAPAFVSNALSGNPTLETLQKMADALSVPVSALLREEECIVGYVEVNGNTHYIHTWDDVMSLISEYQSHYAPGELPFFI